MATALAENTTAIPIQGLDKENFDILYRIGRGGFGEVYLADDKLHHDKVAIKCLIGPVGMDASQKKTLVEEAEKMMHVRDKHVLGIRGLCIESKYDICGLVLPYMPHGSLQQLLTHTYIELPWSLRIRILHQIARGMNALHLLKPQLLHLDLKPGNVLLNDNLDVCVCDFGLSRLIERVTATGVVPNAKKEQLTGTLTHIPPESLSNISHVPNTKFDVYSYGITTWEVLTRKTPYSRMYIQAKKPEDVSVDAVIVSAVKSGQRPDEADIPPVENRYEVQTTIMQSLRKWWAQDPNERPEFTEIVRSTNDLSVRFAQEADISARKVKSQMKTSKVENPEVPSKSLEETISESLKQRRLEKAEQDRVERYTSTTSTPGHFLNDVTVVSPSDFEVSGVSSGDFRGNEVPPLSNPGRPREQSPSQERLSSQPPESTGWNQNQLNPGAAAAAARDANTPSNLGRPGQQPSSQGWAGDTSRPRNQPPGSTGWTPNQHSPSAAAASEQPAAPASTVGPSAGRAASATVSRDHGSHAVPGGTAINQSLGVSLGMVNVNIKNCQNVNIGNQFFITNPPAPRPPDINIPNPDSPLSNELKDRLAGTIHRRRGDGQNLFLRLGLSQEEMRAVARVNPGADMPRLLRLMFDKWQERVGRQATRGRLKDVCCWLERLDLVQVIAEN